MRRLFDVDIDVAPGVDRTTLGVRAMVYNKETEKILPHAAGVYFRDIPVDPLTGNSAIDYETADELGYPKADILNNSAYSMFSTKEEVILFMNMPPKWESLVDPVMVSKLPHIGKHLELIQKIAPTSIIELADCLALIRPGKIHLIDDYLKNKKVTRKNLYVKPKSGIYFKKSHAISYACMIICVMNKINNPSGVDWGH